MKATIRARKRRPKRKHQDDRSDLLPKAGQNSTTENLELSSVYKSGPAVRASRNTGRSSGKTVDNGKRSEVENITVPSASGRGTPVQHSAYGQSFRLQGRTDADFDGGSFHTEDVQVVQGEGCTGKECLHVTDTLVATNLATTSVSLPSVAEFPDLTPCQRERVQTAVTTILAPHEQEHVTAFNTYNGTTSHKFDLTLCRYTFDDRIEAMHQQAATAREAAAQALSDALDPFHFDVDIDCEEEASSEAEAPDGLETKGGEQAPATTKLLS